MDTAGAETPKKRFGIRSHAISPILQGNSNSSLHVYLISNLSGRNKQDGATVTLLTCSVLRHSVLSSIPTPIKCLNSTLIKP